MFSFLIVPSGIRPRCKTCGSLGSSHWQRPSISSATSDQHGCSLSHDQKKCRWLALIWPHSLQHCFFFVLFFCFNVFAFNIKCNKRTESIIFPSWSLSPLRSDLRSFRRPFGVTSVQGSLGVSGGLELACSATSLAFDADFLFDIFAWFVYNICLLWISFPFYTNSEWWIKFFTGVESNLISLSWFLQMTIFQQKNLMLIESNLSKLKSVSWLF